MDPLQMSKPAPRAVMAEKPVLEPTRFIAEAWSIPGFSDNPPAVLIARLGIDALP